MTSTPGRLATLRQLAHPMHLRQAARIGRQPRLRLSILVALQTAATTAIALSLFLLSPFADLVGYASLGALVALFGRAAPKGQRGGIVLAAGLLQTTAVLGMGLLALSAAPLWLQFLALALASGAFYLASTAAPYGPPGALIFVFAGSAAMVPVADLSEVLLRAGATGSVALLALVITLLTERLRAAPTQPEPLAPMRNRLQVALRVVLGAGAAMIASHAAGMDHPAWAAMGALAVLQGSQLHLSLSRALQRMVGTMAGALVAWACLAADPSVASLIALLVLLQLATELVIGANYGLGQVFVTPMALLTMALASPQNGAVTLAMERVLDTLLGVAIAMGVAVLLSTLEDREALARHVA